MTLPSSLRRPLLASAVLLVAACDIPTAAPKWDTSWQVPVNDDSVTIDQLLPSGVTKSGVVLNVAVKQDSIRASLGEMCGAPCAAVHGTTDSLPAFSFTLFVEDSVPEGVVQVTPAAGMSYTYQLRNDLSFDPLRPQGGVFGMIVVGLVDPDSNVIAIDTIRGEDVTVAPGSTLDRAMPVTPAPVTGPFQLAARVIVPAGAVVPIDTGSMISVRSTQDSVGLSSIRVVVDSIAVTSFSTEVDMDGVASEFESSVQSATVKLELDNPMSVGGALVMSFEDGIGNEIVPPKTFTLAVGASEQLITLSQDGIKALLDAGTVNLRVTGVVNGTLGGSVAEIAPDDVARIKSRIFVTVRMGD